MHKRTTVYPPATVSEMRWLVVEDRCGEIIRSARLEPNWDLVAALEGARELYITDGWQVAPLDKWQAVYATKGGERVFIHLSSIAPGSSTVGHGSHLCGNAPGFKRNG